MATRDAATREEVEFVEGLQVDGNAELPPSLAANPDLDTWIRIDQAATVTVFTGKVELGQGIISAITRVAAEELDLAPHQVRVETADTAHGLNEGHTAGSMSVEQSASALRQAAAEVRGILLELASTNLDVPIDQLDVQEGVIRGGEGRQVSYWDLTGGRPLNRRAVGRPSPKHPDAHRIVGRADSRRADLRGLVTGETRFVTDLRRDQMAYGRVVRPPSPGARLVELDAAAIESIPDVLACVRNGSFLGVVAENEAVAIRAADRVRRLAKWTETATLPVGAVPGQWLAEQDDQALLVVDGTPVGPAPELPDEIEWTHHAAYTRPYLLHGSIGPSGAMALWEDDQLLVWSSSQNVYVLQGALAKALDLPVDKVRVRHVVGSGCYGHNAADDAAFDASLLARATPGRPVSLQWSRNDEHQWEPFGAPGRVELRANLDAEGRITRWSHDAWGTTHNSRPMPGSPPNFLAGPYLDPPIHRGRPKPGFLKEYGIHRNATPIYDLADMRIVKRFVASLPLRTSALRSLGAHLNVFAIESFMDELALNARTSPIEFRRRHLGDQRAHEVLDDVVQAAGWDGARSSEFGYGTGLALARYKNHAGYAAVLVNLHLDDDTSQIIVDKIWIAADCGEVIDPRGLVNQLEGGALQSTSWTLKEQVTFDATAVTSIDWDSYDILRFPEVPEIETTLLDRPGSPYLGAGEIVQGPTAAAIGNAIFDAIGFRLRDMPFTPETIQREAERSESAWSDS